ncbi:MAG: hypothetical protein A2Y07_05785 [Planctomycetes bacterium GWF2_50_10]|nr:MAG: hypothetical protein A2Y07_05785 [Planctomycetes bacterium GWF2_50_10]
MRKLCMFMVLASIVLAGCIPSLHPLYTDESIVYDANLIGVWKGDPNKSDTWIFKKEGKNNYQLTVIDEKKKSGVFETYLCKIDGQLFLDIFPDDPNLCQNDFYKAYLLPCHGFIKVNQILPQLKLQMTNPDDFGKKLKEDPNMIKWEKVEDRIVLTASTQQLQEFMRKNAQKDWLFDDEAKLSRVSGDPNKR